MQRAARAGRGRGPAGAARTVARRPAPRRREDADRLHARRREEAETGRDPHRHQRRPLHARRFRRAEGRRPRGRRRGHVEGRERSADGWSRRPGRRSRTRRRKRLIVATPVIDIQQLTKVYHLGEVEVRALDGVDLRVDARRVRGHHGTVRLRQVDADEHPRLPRPADRRHVRARRRRRLAASTATSGPMIRNAKIGFVFQSFNLLARTSRAWKTSSCRCSTATSALSTRERHGSARTALAPRRPGRPRRTTTPRSSPAASSSAWPSPAPWSPTRPSSSPTSPPATSTPAPPSEIMGIFQELNDEGKTIVLGHPRAGHRPTRQARRPHARRPDPAGRAHHPDVERKGCGAAPCDVGVSRAGRRTTASLRPETWTRSPRTPCQLLGNITVVGLKSIARNKMRSLLTALGVVIGVGLRDRLRGHRRRRGRVGLRDDQLPRLELHHDHARRFDAERARMFTGSSTLTEEDAEAISAKPGRRLRVAAVAHHGTDRGRRVELVDADSGRGHRLAEHPRLEHQDGAFFSEGDIRAGAKVAVLGATVADSLFPDGDSVGAIIRVKNVPFKVVGVLEKKGGSMMGSDQDDMIVAPYTTVQKRLMGQQRFGMIIASAALGRAGAGRAGPDRRTAPPAPPHPTRRRRRLHDALAGRDGPGQRAAGRSSWATSCSASPACRSSSAASAS